MAWLNSSVDFRALVLLRMLQTLDCITARKRHCICFVPWSLFGEQESSLDIWEAGSPCCASAFPPAPKAVELEQRPALVYIASSERTGAGTRLLVHAWCCVFIASSSLWHWSCFLKVSLRISCPHIPVTFFSLLEHDCWESQFISWERAPSKRNVLCVRSQS